MILNRRSLITLFALLPLTVFSIDNKNNGNINYEIRTIEKLLRQYVKAEELRDKETQFQILSFPNLKGRENSTFDIYDQRKYAERIDKMLEKSPRSLIRIHNLSIRLLGKNFAMAEFTWDFSYPDSKDLYVGKGYVFLEKRNEEWKIIMQYDIDY
jgi:hypothetical protein